MLQQAGWDSAGPIADVLTMPNGIADMVPGGWGVTMNRRGR